MVTVLLYPSCFIVTVLLYPGPQSPVPRRAIFHSAIFILHFSLPFAVPVRVSYRPLGKDNALCAG